MVNSNWSYQGHFILIDDRISGSEGILRVFYSSHISLRRLLWERERDLVSETKDPSVGKAGNRKTGWHKWMEKFQAFWEQFQYLLMEKSLQKCISLWGSCEICFFGIVVKLLVKWPTGDPQLNRNTEPPKMS